MFSVLSVLHLSSPVLNSSILFLLFTCIISCTLCFCEGVSQLHLKPLRLSNLFFHISSAVSYIEQVFQEYLTILSWLWVTKISPGTWIIGKNYVVFTLYTKESKWDYENHLAVSHSHTILNNFWENFLGKVIADELGVVGPRCYHKWGMWSPGGPAWTPLFSFWLLYNMLSNTYLKLLIWDMFQHGDREILYYSIFCSQRWF